MFSIRILKAGSIEKTGASGQGLGIRKTKTLDPRFTTSIRELRPTGQPEAVQIVPDDLVTGMTFLLATSFFTVIPAQAGIQCLL